MRRIRGLCFIVILLSLAGCKTGENESHLESVNVEKSLSEELIVDLNATSDRNRELRTDVQALVRADTPMQQRQETRRLLSQIGTMIGEIRASVISLENKLSETSNRRPPREAFTEIDDREFDRVIAQLRSLIEDERGGGRGGRFNDGRRPDNTKDGVLGELNAVAESIIARLNELEQEERGDSPENSRQRGERRDRELRNLLEDFRSRSNSVDMIISRVIGTLNVWVANARMAHPSVNPFQPCGINLFSDCRWQPSSEFLSRSREGNQLLKNCVAGEPRCENEFARIRSNLVAWFQDPQLTNREEVLKQLRSRQLTINISDNIGHGYNSTDNTLNLPIAAADNTDNNRFQFFNAVGLIWRCLETIHCEACRNSGQRNCRVYDCKGQTTRNYTEACTPADTCVAYTRSTECSNQANCSWSYTTNTCFTRQGRECTYYNPFGATPCAAQPDCSWNYNKNVCFIRTGQACSYYTDHGSTSCSSQSNCSWNYNKQECFIRTGQSCSYYTPHGSSACSSQSNCTWNYSNNTCNPR